MNATQGVILIMLGALVLYLVWNDKILQGIGRGGATAHPATPGSSGESGLNGGGAAGSGAGGGGGGSY